MKIALTSFFILVVFLLFGQSPTQKTLYHKADSLGKNNNFSGARKIINQLLKETKDQKKDRYFHLHLLQLKSKLLEKNNLDKSAITFVLKAIDEAKELNNPKNEYLSRLSLALIYEKTSDLVKCKQQLDTALFICDNAHLVSIKAKYYVRVSSYYRFANDSLKAVENAYNALKNATKYHAEYQLRDAHLLLGILLSNYKPKIAIKHYDWAKNNFIKHHEYSDVMAMLNNIATTYLHQNKLDSSLIYSDSVFYFSRVKKIKLNSYLYWTRAQIYNQKNQKDSAIYYYKKQIDLYEKEVNKQNSIDLKRLTQLYEGDKAMATLEKKINKYQFNKKITYLVIFVSTIILFLLIILYSSYSKIKSDRQKIKRQNEALNQSIIEKELLLSELQHRVKNNLQMIIGILELQKEEEDLTDIVAITNESQDRIKALSLLNEKIYFKDNDTLINIDEYLSDIIHLMQQSLFPLKKTITIKKITNFSELNVKIAVPLGIILVELIRNSIKHGFKNKRSGNIKIELKKNENKSLLFNLIYNDDGDGLEDSESRKNGIGMEIIKGLVKQLKGSIVVSSDNGISVKINFYGK